MSSGTYGTPMNGIEHLKKPTPIPCNCNQCNHSTVIDRKIYCGYYKKFPLTQKKCSAYYGPNQKSKQKKIANA